MELLKCSISHSDLGTLQIIASLLVQLVYLASLSSCVLYASESIASLLGQVVLYLSTGHDIWMDFILLREAVCLVRVCGSAARHMWVRAF
jgi:hypothetical protein